MRCLRCSTSSRRRSSSSFDLNSAPRRGRERPHLFLSCLAMRRVVGAIIQHKVTHGSQIVQHQYSGVPALLTCNLSLGPAEHVNGYCRTFLWILHGKFPSVFVERNCSGQKNCRESCEKLLSVARPH